MKNIFASVLSFALWLAVIFAAFALAFVLSGVMVRALMWASTACRAA